MATLIQRLATIQAAGQPAKIVEKYLGRGPSNPTAISCVSFSWDSLSPTWPP
jgi:hypothetical protein